MEERELQAAGMSPGQLTDELADAAKALGEVRRQVARVIVGQKYMIDRLLIALLADGHVLLEGVPGLAKTTAVKAVANTLEAQFSRIQFTPDLLPADVIGTQIYNPRDGGFSTRKGPIFTNILLADEINRAPAKVQSALLEAMQERQVTLADQTWKLPRPFLVLATQNPIEQEGTYPLPEAQVDRFMMKLVVSYPSAEEERQILDRSALPVAQPDIVLDPARILRIQELTRRVTVKPMLAGYIVNLVQATRQPGSLSSRLARLVQFGASPRATIALAAAARAAAVLDGREFATPDDVKEVALDVLRHRVILTYEAEAEQVTPDQVIREILSTVKTP
ncbi:MAG: MoxR family ATPase [Pseudomonadota bacterium]|nr:MoxR family ATPase [Pseudomonadota bacterium]